MSKNLLPPTIIRKKRCFLSDSQTLGIIQMVKLTFVIFDHFRSNAAPKRGRASRRPAPYRHPGRNHGRDAPSTSWANESQSYPPYPPWPPMQWSQSKTPGQPLPPGEDKQPQRFGPSPDANKIRCFSCFKFGHKSPNCPDKQSQSQ